MKHIISYTLLASFLSAALPWAGYCSTGEPAKTVPLGISDWGNGVTVRQSSDSQAVIDRTPGKISVSHVTGRFYVRIAGKSDVAFVTLAGVIVASNGEFLLDSAGAHAQLHVFQGDARLENPTSDVRQPTQAKAWAKKPLDTEVALRGSDVRRRDVSPDEFAKRKARTKGVDQAKTKPVVAPTTPPPPEVTTPPPPVTTTPPPPVTTTPPPPVDNPPVVVEGGGVSPFLIGGGLALLGGGIFLLVNNSGNNGNDNSSVVVAPASP